MSRTISIDNFNKFYWKTLPIEKEYCNITFCTSCLTEEKDKLHEPDNSTETNDDINTDNISYYLNKINNQDTQNTLKYIFDIMPFTCILNIESYEMFLNSEKLKNEIETNTHINKENFKKSIDEEQINDTLNIVKNITRKLTYINFYNEKNKKDILNITMNKNFNKIHRVCIGDITNIPKDTLSISDYIFFDNIEQINKYFRLSNYNIEINYTNSKIYLIDKCNYKDSQLFSFDNYIR